MKANDSSFCKYEVRVDIHGGSPAGGSKDIGGSRRRQFLAI